MPDTFQDVKIDVDHGNFNPDADIWKMIDGKKAILGDEVCIVKFDIDSQQMSLILDNGSILELKPADLASFGKFGMGSFEIKIKGEVNKKLRIIGLDLFAEKDAHYTEESEQ